MGRTGVQTRQPRDTRSNCNKTPGCNRRVPRPASKAKGSVINSRCTLNWSVRGLNHARGLFEKLR
eukprot:12042957-Alexandrium_andersonii.AAC.1